MVRENEMCLKYKQYIQVEISRRALKLGTVLEKGPQKVVQCVAQVTSISSEVRLPKFKTWLDHSYSVVF